MASYYYMSHKTMLTFQEKLARNSSIMDLLKTFSESEEYAEFPVRHDEDEINKYVINL